MARWEPGVVLCPKCGAVKGVYESGKTSFPCCGILITIEERLKKAA